MAEHIVLVEPNYYTKFPPLGLLKLSRYEKNNGNSTELVRKGGFPKKKPDKVYVTSLFTWAWRPVKRVIYRYKTRYPDVEISLGGLYASILPKHAERYTEADKICTGLVNEVENLMPDYSLVPNWDGSIIFASRGCNNKCPFCVVPRLEGKINLEKKSIKHLVHSDHTKIIFFDNNILAMSYWRDIFKELLLFNKDVDFNQGLEARLITKEVAKYISKMRLPLIRLAYDGKKEKEYVERGIKNLHQEGISKRKILVYSLFNYTETPEEYLERVIEILEWGASCYPMRYQPLNSTKKHTHVSTKWTENELEMIATARRVIGYGGSFPPYEGLIKKLKRAKDFQEAFELYPVKKSETEKEIEKKLALMKIQ